MTASDLTLLKSTQIYSWGGYLPQLMALYSEFGDLSKSCYKKCHPVSSSNHSLTYLLL